MSENISVESILDHMEKVIIGKRNVLKQLLVALLSDGHVLIEDVPGVGKTQIVSTLSQSVSGRFHRVQFTSDFMPSDIMGFSIFNPANREFEYKEGAAMCNFLLYIHTLSNANFNANCINLFCTKFFKRQY